MESLCLVRQLRVRKMPRGLPESSAREAPMITAEQAAKILRLKPVTVASYVGQGR